jgi:hypothetical protein
MRSPAENTCIYGAVHVEPAGVRQNWGKLCDGAYQFNFRPYAITAKCRYFLHSTAGHGCVAYTSAMLAGRWRPCYCSAAAAAVLLWCVCVCIITPVTIIKLFAWGEGDSGGHVLRETTSRGLCGLVCPSHTSKRGGEGDCVKEGGGEEGERERGRALGLLLFHIPRH